MPEPSIVGRPTRNTWRQSPPRPVSRPLGQAEVTLVAVAGLAARQDVPNRVVPIPAQRNHVVRFGLTIHRRLAVCAAPIERQEQRHDLRPGERAERTELPRPTRTGLDAQRAPSRTEPLANTISVVGLAAILAGSPLETRFQRRQSRDSGGRSTRLPGRSPGFRPGDASRRGLPLPQAVGVAPRATARGVRPFSTLPRAEPSAVPLRGRLLDERPAAVAGDKHLFVPVGLVLPVVVRRAQPACQDAARTPRLPAFCLEGSPLSVSLPGAALRAVDPLAGRDLYWFATNPATSIGPRHSAGQLIGLNSGQICGMPTVIGAIFLRQPTHWSVECLSANSADQSSGVHNRSPEKRKPHAGERGASYSR